jgi:type II secretory pathway predicted ATPase ExeA
MYYEHFGLNYPPFKITPDPQLFYSGGNRGLVLEALVYAIENGEGIIKLVGEVGSGKTMLCRMLEEKLSKRIEIVYLGNPRLPPEMILHAIALEMHMPVTPQSNRLQVMHDLHLKLLEKHTNNQQVVVFIEEAQGMPLTTLEEIRLLSNLETARHKLLQIVLFGQPELDINLSIPHIRQLKERITHSFYLTALTRLNIEEYLTFRMRAVGYRGPPVFSPGAIRVLTKVSNGLMRRINILADKALLATFAENAHYVLPKHIWLAARDSGFASPKISTGVYLGLGIVSITALILWGWWSPYKQSVEYWLSNLNTTLPVFSSSNKPKEEVITMLLSQRLQATESWLATTTGQHYTIQIMQTAENNRDELEGMLHTPEIRSLLEELYVSRDNLKGQVKWNIMYGEFTDAESAKAAIAKLPEVLRRNKPYPRKIANLRSN